MLRLQLIKQKGESLEPSGVFPKRIFIKRGAKAITTRVRARWSNLYDAEILIQRVGSKHELESLILKKRYEYLD